MPELETHRSRQSDRSHFAVAANLLYAVATATTAFLAALLILTGAGYAAVHALGGAVFLAVCLLLNRKGLTRSAMVLGGFTLLVLSFVLTDQVGWSGGVSVLITGSVMVAFLNRRWQSGFAIVFAAAIIILATAISLHVGPDSLGLPKASLGATHTAVLLGLAAAAAWLYGGAMRRQEERLESALESADRSARTDPLTHLLNRPTMDALIDLETARCRRNGQPLTLIAAEVDSFENLVATRGRPCGDWILVSVADLLRRVMRAHDHTARFSDQRFLLLLPNTDREGAGVAAERLRTEVERSSFVFDDDEVEFSLSLALAACHDNDTVEAMLAALDLALEEGRKVGGNQVVLA